MKMKKKKLLNKFVKDSKARGFVDMCYNVCVKTDCYFVFIPKIRKLNEM